MSFLAGLIGAAIFAIVLLVAATLVPKYFRDSKTSAPDPGADAAGGGGYGSYGMNDFSGGDCGGDGD